MPTSGLHTAILVFIRDEQEETRVKRFADFSSLRTHRRIVRILNRRIERLASGTGLPTFIVSGNQQVGNDFGERFTNAIKGLFDRGFRRVISVGNDCLSLTCEHLLEVNRMLERTPLVLGPTYDGGAYIIGIDRAVFRQEAFRGLPWQCSELLPALVAYGRQSGCDPFLMPTEWDADDVVSFARAFDELAGNHPLVRLLCPLLLPTQRPAWLNTSPSGQVLLNSPLLRGPPVFSFPASFMSFC